MIPSRRVFTSRRMQAVRALVVLLCTVTCGIWAGERAPVVDELSTTAQALNVPAVKVKGFTPVLSSEKIPDLTCWSGPLTLGHLDGKAERALPVKTEGYFACDDKHLYVLLRCFESSLDAVPGATAARDGNVWGADNLEIMLLPGLDPREPYYQFALDPGGGVFDAKINDKSWNAPNVKTWRWRDQQTWTVALRVPFSDMGQAAGAVPAVWRINLHRMRPKRGGTALDLAWSPTHSRSNHVPSRFGLAYMAGAGAVLDGAALKAFTDSQADVHVVFRQDFSKSREGFDAGEIVTEGGESFLRAEKVRKISLERNFGAIAGLRMAFAYRTAAEQHGLVVHGSGTAIRAARPGLIEVWGRGLKIAQTTCHDADGQSRAADLGFGGFLFNRPYGH